MSVALITFADEPDGSVNAYLSVCGDGDTPAVNKAELVWECLQKAIAATPPPEPSPEQPVA